jgi:hypothetical protein
MMLSIECRHYVYCKATHGQPTYEENRRGVSFEKILLSIDLIQEVFFILPKYHKKLYEYKFFQFFYINTIIVYE